MNLSQAQTQQLHDQGYVVIPGVIPREMVDAALKAIDRLTKTRGKLMDYSLRSVSQGKDALGEVTVKVDFGDGELITGKGASTDIVEASARAYLNAVNRFVSKSNGSTRKKARQPVAKP